LFGGSDGCAQLDSLLGRPLANNELRGPRGSARAWEGRVGGDDPARSPEVARRSEPALQRAPVATIISADAEKRGMDPRRAARVLLTVAAISATAIAAACAVGRHLTVNITPSLPRGLYWLTSEHDPRVGSIVVLFPPPPIRKLIAERRYLPPALPLLKRVVALPGNTVCTDSGRYVARGVYAR
jgi:hypothetical protein